MLKALPKVMTHPFEGSQVTMRELSARAFLDLQQKHADQAGLDFSADLLQRCLVDPSYTTAEETKQVLLDLPLHAIEELVRLALVTSKLDKDQGN